MLEHDLGAVHVGLDRAYRAVHDERDSHGGGEMHHDVGIVHELGDHRVVCGRADRVLEARMALEVADVLDGPRGEVVEHVHGVVMLDKQIAQMRADETRAAGDQEPHGVFTPLEGIGGFVASGLPRSRRG